MIHVSEAFFFSSPLMFGRILESYGVGAKFRGLFFSFVWAGGATSMASLLTTDTAFDSASPTGSLRRPGGVFPQTSPTPPHNQQTTTPHKSATLSLLSDDTSKMPFSGDVVAGLLWRPSRICQQAACNELLQMEADARLGWTDSLHQPQKTPHNRGQSFFQAFSSFPLPPLWLVRY